MVRDHSPFPGDQELYLPILSSEDKMTLLLLFSLKDYKYTTRGITRTDRILLIHTYTDTGLSENNIYCYSAWDYDERTNKYSNGFILACGGVPPSDSTNLSMISTTLFLLVKKKEPSSTTERALPSLTMPLDYSRTLFTVTPSGHTTLIPLLSLLTMSQPVDPCLI